MDRIKIAIPAVFSFKTEIPVRISDVNYGGHVGNDSILAIIHEARLQYLNSLGYTELAFANTSLIMADVAIEYKSELLYGDVVTVMISSGNLSRVGFSLYYKLEKRDSGGIVAVAKTGMVCFDYPAKKVVALPDEARQKLHQP